MRLEPLASAPTECASRVLRATHSAGSRSRWVTLPLGGWEGWGMGGRGWEGGCGWEEGLGLGGKGGQYTHRQRRLRSPSRRSSRRAVAFALAGVAATAHTAP